jgi:orotidine-5'-phosphate decarboxylase
VQLDIQESTAVQRKECQFYMSPSSCVGGFTIQDPFLSKLREISERKRNRLILALDSIGERSSFGEEEVRELLDKVRKHVSGIKLGLPAEISLGKSTERVIGSFPDLVFIADWKLADIPEVCGLTSRALFERGFDAVIVHSFVGAKSLEAAKRAAEEAGGGVIAVAAMSHPDATLVNSNVDQNLMFCRMARINSLVAPATNPKIISKVKSGLPDSTIFSPGVGTQGGEGREAILAGADYLIVGRSITSSGDPVRSAASLVTRIWG